jgi:hypothetical protein
MTRLHTAAVKLYPEVRVYPEFSLSVADATRIMQSSCALRRLSVNDVETEVRRIFSSVHIVPCSC